MKLIYSDTIILRWWNTKSDLLLYKSSIFAIVVLTAVLLVACCWQSDHPHVHEKYNRLFEFSRFRAVEFSRFCKNRVLQFSPAPLLAYSPAVFRIRPVNFWTSRIRRRIRYSEVKRNILCWCPEGHWRKVQDPEQEPNPDVLVRGTDPWIRIRIRNTVGVGRDGSRYGDTTESMHYEEQYQPFVHTAKTLSDSYPAFFLPIATTSNKNF
jgi:hypothetical protein